MNPVPVGTTVTQGTATGKLLVSLVGETTQIEIESTIDQEFVDVYPYEHLKIEGFQEVIKGYIKSVRVEIYGFNATVPLQIFLFSITPTGLDNDNMFTIPKGAIPKNLQNKNLEYWKTLVVKQDPNRQSTVIGYYVANEDTFELWIEDAMGFSATGELRLFIPITPTNFDTATNEFTIPPTQQYILNNTEVIQEGIDHISTLVTKKIKIIPTGLDNNTFTISNMPIKNGSEVIQNDNPTKVVVTTLSTVTWPAPEGSTTLTIADTPWFDDYDKELLILYYTIDPTIVQPQPPTHCGRQCTMVFL